MRVERVVERLNGEFAGVARLEAIRWESKFYKAHATFQQQIPEASDCDLVVAILRHRLGTELPADFPTMPTGSRILPAPLTRSCRPSRRARRRRSPTSTSSATASRRPCASTRRARTGSSASSGSGSRRFFKNGSRSADGHFKLAFHTFANTDAFEAEVDKLLRTWLEEQSSKAASVLWPIDIKGSPFRGLAAFGAKHAPVFFGRSRDITRAIDALKDAAERGTPFLLVVGAERRRQVVAGARRP